MKYIVLMAGVILALAGCAAHDRQMATDFKPTRDKSGFEYRAFADAIIGLDSADGEAYRMTMLKKWLDENSMCPRGYDITERQVVQRREGLLANVYDVNYRGACRT